jgi:hypothetical protein
MKPVVTDECRITVVVSLVRKRNAVSRTLPHLTSKGEGGIMPRMDGGPHQP